MLRWTTVHPAMIWAQLGQTDLLYVTLVRLVCIQLHVLTGLGQIGIVIIPCIHNINCASGHFISWYTLERRLGGPPRATLDTVEE
jgi:hypothetical protein